MRPTGNDTAFDDLARRSDAHEQGGAPIPGDAGVAPARPVDTEPASEPVPDAASHLEVRP